MASCGKCSRCKAIGKIVSATGDALPPSSLSGLLNTPCPAQTTRAASTPGSDSWGGIDPSLVQPDEPVEPPAPAQQPEAAPDGLAAMTQAASPQVNRPTPADFPLAMSPPLPPLEVRNLPSPPPLDDDSDDEDDLPMLTQIMSRMKSPATQNRSRKERDRAARKGGRERERKVRPPPEEVKVKAEPEEDDDMYMDYPEDAVVQPEPTNQDPRSLTADSTGSHLTHHDDDVSPVEEEDGELDELHDGLPPQPKVPSKKKRKLSLGDEAITQPVPGKKVKREPGASPGIPLPPASRSPSIPLPAAQQSASKSNMDKAFASDSRRTSTSAATTHQSSTTPATSVPPTLPRPRPILVRTSKVPPPPATAPPSSASTVKRRSRDAQRLLIVPVPPSRRIASGTASTSRPSASKLPTSTTTAPAAPSNSTSKPHSKKSTESYTPPSTIASLLRASHLLRVRDFKAYAQRAFEDVWSDDLESVCRGDLRRSGVSATEAVLLGRLCGLPGVVKRGMYELLKSETFEQGDSESEDETGDDDEESEDSEDDESDVSIIVIDSDIEMISTSRTGRTKKVKTTKPKKPKAKETKQKWTLPQKDFTLLTKARSKLIARWNRETIQFPESLLPCPDAATNAPSSGDAGESSSSAGDEGDGEDWYTCAASDAATAREAHRRLVIQSGLQESYMYDVLGGLSALEDLRWGWSPAKEEDEKTNSSSSQSGSEGDDEDEDEGEREKEVRANGKATPKQDEDDDGEEVYHGEFCGECVKKMKRMWRGVRERVWKDCEELFSIKR